MAAGFPLGVRRSFYWEIVLLNRTVRQGRYKALYCNRWGRAFTPAAGFFNSD